MTWFFKLFIFHFISFLFIYLNSQFNPMFFKKQYLSYFFYNLNLALSLHLANNSHLLFNNFSGSG